MPHWSPDGKWIACFSDRGGRLQVWKVRVDGSELTQLSGGDAEFAYAVWSPDSSRLAAGAVATSASPAKGNHFQILNANQPYPSQRGDEVALPGPDLFAPNSWSSDGRTIIGQRRVSMPSIALFTVADRSLTELAAFGEWPVWFPDNRRILFVTKRHEFHVFDAVTRTDRTVLSAPHDTLGPPRLTRDGRTVFFSRRVTEADIWIATLP